MQNSMPSPEFSDADALAAIAALNAAAVPEDSMMRIRAMTSEGVEVVVELDPKTKTFQIWELE